MELTLPKKELLNIVVVVLWFVFFACNNVVHGAQGRVRVYTMSDKAKQ